MTVGVSSHKLEVSGPFLCVVVFILWVRPSIIPNIGLLTYRSVCRLVGVCVIKNLTGIVRPCLGLRDLEQQTARLNRIRMNVSFRILELRTAKNFDPQKGFTSKNV